MSKTVILDGAERDRRLINHLNEILRHCRIGRVEQKAPGSPSTLRLLDIMKAQPTIPAWPFNNRQGD